MSRAENVFLSELLPVFNPLHLRFAGSFSSSGPLQELAYIAKLGLRAIRVVKIVTFLQNRPMLGNTSKSCCSGCLAGKPMAFTIVVIQIKLGIAVSCYPNCSGRNVVGPTNRNE